MEIIVELLFMLLQFLGEIVLQIVFEALAEVGFRSLREPFRRPRPLHPFLAAVGYAILGALAGALSLWIFPANFIEPPALRLANLICAPVAAGLAMGALGAWRRRRHEDLIRLDRFSYGYLFALAMAAIRYFWGE